MLIKKDTSDSFVYDGVFYNWVGDTLQPIYSCKCDIQDSGAKKTNLVIIKAGYYVYFPMQINADGSKSLVVDKGMEFVCDNVCGNRINGTVISVYQSELGYGVAYLEDKDV